MSDVRWMVLRDSFPFSTPTDLGMITAPDKQAAIDAAVEQFGGKVIVRSMLSLEVEKYERAATKVTPRALSRVEDDEDPPLTRHERFRLALKRAGITADAWSLEAGLDQSTVSKVSMGKQKSPGILARIDEFVAAVDAGAYRVPTHAKPKRKSQLYGRGQGKGYVAVDISRAHELKRGFGCIVALLFALLASSCSSTSAPACDPPHTWSVRMDLEHHPHSYFWCTCGQHEPRDRAESDDANAWYLRSTPAPR